MCNNLEKNGWVIIPEAIRYIEKENSKIINAAIDIPNNNDEEEYYQTQLFRVELEKIKKANHYRNMGYNVIIDKSSISIIATAKAFEVLFGFNNKYLSACKKYIMMLEFLKNNDLVECDGFLLLTTDYNKIQERNNTRKHILEGIWIDESLINLQKNCLKKIYDKVVGKYSDNEIKKCTLDTTFLSQDEVFNYFVDFAMLIQSNVESKERIKK